MASRKSRAVPNVEGVPVVSRKAVRATVAPARARKTEGGGEAGDDEADEAAPAAEAEAKPVEARAAEVKADAKASEPKPTEAKPAEAKAPEKAPDAKADAGPAAAKPADARPPAEVRPAEPKPTAEPMPPAEPRAAAPAPSEPAITALPDPRSVEPGDPDASEPPPGLVPSGDSRSLRRGRSGAEEFALVYRVKSFLVTRTGPVGKRGQWRVVEYPTQSSAAHAYAQECSRLVTEGYVDFRG